MATREVLTLTDDIDGSEGAQTLRFSVDGTDYEIELSTRNRERFDKAIMKYVQAGRRVPRKRTKRS